MMPIQILKAAGRSPAASDSDQGYTFVFVLLGYHQQQPVTISFISSMCCIISMNRASCA